MLTRVRNDRVGVYTLVHAYDDADEAAAYGLWDSVNWWYRHLAEFTLQWELVNLPEEEKAKVFPLLESVIEVKVPVDHYQNEDMIIIGTPEECLQKILRYESVGVDQLLCYVQFGDLPHDKVMRNLELLAKDVMPELEARGHRVDATVRA
jgi:alkanesulfonate monooxygenase SsuD/methylene tetrahydromethanopterin reductase-like flavin-dependent oxidoreductase (luciferase family)